MGFLIDMIDVGQGDAFLLTLGTPTRDVTVLIDAGPPDEGGTVANFVLKYARGSLDAVICSHFDIDHVGGFTEVLDRCTVSRFYINLPSHPDVLLETLRRQRYQEFKKHGGVWDMLEKSLEAIPDLVGALGRHGLSPQPIMSGMSWNLGDVVVRVLNPDANKLQEAWEELEADEAPFASVMRELAKSAGVEVAPETTAHNNASVVLDLVYKGVPYALLPSDAGADVIREVTANQSYPFLKVPHHGSKTGLDEALVEQLHPKSAYISVGENAYKHPAPEILKMLREHGAKTYCSRKAESCPPGCPADGFGSLCHQHEHPWHPGYSATDSSKCVNNR